MNKIANNIRHVEKKILTVDRSVQNKVIEPNAHSKRFDGKTIKRNHRTCSQGLSFRSFEDEREKKKPNRLAIILIHLRVEVKRWANVTMLNKIDLFIVRRICRVTCEFRPLIFNRRSNFFSFAQSRCGDHSVDHFHSSRFRLSLPSFSTATPHPT